MSKTILFTTMPDIEEKLKELEEYYRKNSEEHFSRSEIIRIAIRHEWKNLIN